MVKLVFICPKILDIFHHQIFSGHQADTDISCPESGSPQLKSDLQTLAKSPSLSWLELGVSAGARWGPATFPFGVWGVAHQLLSAKCTHI